MTPEQFVYWLQGYYELTDDTDRLSKRDHIIRDHLKTVFEKRTPNRDLIGYEPTNPMPDTPPIETDTPPDLYNPTIIC